MFTHGIILLRTMNNKALIVQSISDVITNSSSELFIVCKEDMLHYIEEYDEPNIDCFDVRKLTWDSIKAEEYMFYDVKNSESTEYYLVLRLLRISEEDAMKEGLKLVWKEYKYEYNDHVDRWLIPIDMQDEFFGSSDEVNKKRRDATKEFFKSWCDFCKKHHDEIRDKVIGKYIMEVEDHFERWSDFREDIEKRGWLYSESHH